jgi:hypothetical protein
MSLTNVQATSGKKKFSRLEDGTYMCRVVQLIDLGVQEDEYEGEKKVGHKIFINFEFPTEMITINEEEKPRWLGKEFGVSLNEKSVLTKLVAAADPDGKATSKGRNLKGLLNLPLMVTVGSTASGNAKIAGLARLMKGMTVPELVNPVVFFDLDEGDTEGFEKLPDWIQNKIKASVDFEDTVLAKAMKGNGKVSHSETVGGIEDMEDDRPY